MIMNKYICLVGLPASGKSTIAEKIAKNENAIIHSSDNLREELFGDVNDVKNNQKLFQELHRRIKTDLQNGLNVIYDATNINYKKRKEFLREIKNINCFKKCVLVATPYEQCLEQNQLRERKVPEYVINRMYKSIFIPQYYEGWDDIEIEWNMKREYIYEELFNELDKIPQDNPNHSMTIGHHCIKCFMNLNVDNDNLKKAAALHDIGKAFTKEFKNGKGETTEIAHYYQHHLVSAYMSLFYFYWLHERDLLEVTNYIQWHMQPFFIDTDKAKNKFIKLVGKEFYNDLLILHEADKKAR